MMGHSSRARAAQAFVFSLSVAGALLGAPANSAHAAVIPAAFDSIRTDPGDARIVLNLPGGAQTVLLEGAPERDLGNRPLTAAQVDKLNALAPGLGLVTYHVAWVDQHGSVVGPDSHHGVRQITVPDLNTSPNFDTVIQRLDDLDFTAPGQTRETRLRIIMLDLVSVAPIAIGGFHYDVLVQLANGDPIAGPVCDNPCTQATGNLDVHSTSIDSSGVHGTLDMGITGSAIPTQADLVNGFPVGVLGFPVHFDLQFIPVDGGGAIPDVVDFVGFQNPTLGTIDPIPEPASAALLGFGALALAGARARRRG